MIKKFANKTPFRKITFKSLSGTTLELKKSFLYINRDLIDLWTPFLFNSIGSFEKILINIKNYNETSSSFFILNNANFESDEKNLVIKLLNEPIKYVSVKKFKDTKIEEKKQIKNKIKYLKSYNQVSGEINEFIKLKVLEEKLYELEAIKSFSLKKEE